MNNEIISDIEILKILPENTFCHITLFDKKFYFKFFFDFFGQKVIVMIDSKGLYHVPERCWHEIKVLDKEMYLN